MVFIRTIFQIIKTLLKIESEQDVKCSQCGSTDLVTEELLPDQVWYDKHIRQKSRNKSPTERVKILISDPSLTSRTGELCLRQKK
jgi:hypothetical protein